MSFPCIDYKQTDHISAMLLLGDSDYAQNQKLGDEARMECKAIFVSKICYRIFLVEIFFKVKDKYEFQIFINYLSFSCPADISFRFTGQQIELILGNSSAGRLAARLACRTSGS